MIGVKDEAELHMLLVCMWSSCRDRAASFLYTLMGPFARHLPCQLGAIMPYGFFERIKTLFLHLSRIITSERSTRASTCMHVTSRIAGSPNLASWILAIATLAL